MDTSSLILDIGENIAYRRWVLDRAKRDVRFQEAEWIHSKRDPLYWVNTYGWLYEPRGDRHKSIPFVLYTYQIDIMDGLWGALGKEDALIEKTRDMGATWMGLYVLLHRYLFDEWFTGLCLSRNEDLVDDGTPDSLFWKLDYGVRRLPDWMRPGTYRKHLQMRNMDRNNAVSGSSTTADFARGGRQTVLLLDEFASIPNGDMVLSSTRDVTRSRFFFSTPKGQNHFYAMRQRPGVKTFTIHWKDHPEKGQGLYRYTVDGDLEILDTGYEFPKDYEFRDGNRSDVIGGALRSPWYDRECDRSPNSTQIAQELDIDYLGSDYTFFEMSDLDRYIREHCREETLRGMVPFNTGLEPEVFIPMSRGDLRLWCELEGGMTPYRDTSYVIGADIASGTGATNSVASIWRQHDAVKIGEFVTAHMDPGEFADNVMALGYWFKDKRDIPALIVFEMNGPGQVFRKRVTDHGYENLWYRESERKKPIRTRIPGWVSNNAPKYDLLGSYRYGIHKDAFDNPCMEALTECRHYIYSPTANTIEHSGAMTGDDPSSNRENHGDRVIADALAWMAVREKMENLDIPDQMLHNLSQGEYMTTLDYRRKAWESERTHESGYWA